MIVVDAGHIPGILHQFYYLFVQKYLREKNVKEDRFRIRVRNQSTSFTLHHFPIIGFFVHDLDIFSLLQSF